MYGVLTALPYRFSGTIEDVEKTQSTHDSARERESYTLVHRHHPDPSVWDDFNVWYHAAADEVSDSDAVRELISNLAKLGINVVTVPAISPNNDPSYVETVIDRADKRGLRVLPNIGFAMMAELGREPFSDDERREVVEHWMKAGAWGVELGNERVELNSDHRHGGQNVLDLQAQLSVSNPDAVVSIGLVSDDDAAILEHVHEDFFHVVRTPIRHNPLTPENIGMQLLSSYNLFDSAGTIPAWDMTVEALQLASRRLSVEGVMVMMLSLPGMVHFTRGALDRFAGVRHALRIRASHRLAVKNLALDEGRANRGIISLYVDHTEVRMNFGWDDDHLADDGSVTLSSRIELPKADDELVLPASDVAWISTAK